MAKVKEESTWVSWACFDGQRRKHGVQVTVSKKGYILNMLNYEDGYKHGEVMRFHTYKANMIAETGTYYDNKLDGEWRWWGIDGSDCGRSKMNRGTGQWASFHKDTKCQKYQSGTLVNGKVIGTFKSWFRGGKIRSVETVVDSPYRRTVKIYRSNGQTHSVLTEDKKRSVFREYCEGKGQDAKLVKILKRDVFSDELIVTRTNGCRKYHWVSNKKKGRSSPAWRSSKKREIVPNWNHWSIHWQSRSDPKAYGSYSRQPSKYSPHTYCGAYSFNASAAFMNRSVSYSSPEASRIMHQPEWNERGCETRIRKYLGLQ